MNIRSIYRCLLILTALAVVIGGCAKPPSGADEGSAATAPTVGDDRGFDPLELPQDREVVPALYPREGIIHGKQVLVDVQPEQEISDSTVVSEAPATATADLLNGQAYRVQLFTSKLYGEAKDAVAVAEEIFDRPVSLDYEVPYFKVRVGSFADRDDAESYQMKAKAAGYTDAWVVMVNLGVKEVAPLYDNLGPLETPEPVRPADTTAPGNVEQ